MAKEIPQDIVQDVHGYKVFGAKDAKYGIDYLDHDLDYEEAKVHFHHARYSGPSKFEDARNRNFTLKYNGDGTYTVAKRKASGWW
ncbi:hypothetical protein KKI23_03130 [Patescibacteria group bacterium]|nr:hypothetical protein [Patescibacteria group bacterium]